MYLLFFFFFSPGRSLTHTRARVIIRIYFEEVTLLFWYLAKFIIENKLFRSFQIRFTYKNLMSLDTTLRAWKRTRTIALHYDPLKIDARIMVYSLHINVQVATRFQGNAVVWPPSSRPLHSRSVRLRSRVKEREEIFWRTMRVNLFQTASFLAVNTRRINWRILFRIYISDLWTTTE